MESKNNNTECELENLNATAGAILIGPYAKLAKALQTLEERLPSGVTLIYKRFSPGRIYLVVEGDDQKGRGY